MVYFAYREDDNSDRFNADIKNIEKQAKGKIFNFVMATRQDFLDQIKQSNAIFFSGGSTDKLLEILRTYPDLKPLVEGRTVAGSSEGAYMLAQFGASHSEAIVREGLGFVPLRVVCHYESPDLPPSTASVEVLKNTVLNLELVLLKDFEWKVFKF